MTAKNMARCTLSNLEYFFTLFPMHSSVDESKAVSSQVAHKTTKSIDVLLYMCVHSITCAYVYVSECVVKQASNPFRALTLSNIQLSSLQPNLTINLHLSNFSSLLRFYPCVANLLIQAATLSVSCRIVQLLYTTIFANKITVC